MTAVRVNAFGGMLPSTDARLLPDASAALAQNTWLYNGELVGTVSPSSVRNMANSGYGKVFRIPNNYTDATHLTDATWMEFSSIDTDVIRSPIVGDTYDRYYWASPVDQPRLNSKARIIAGSASYYLGVPQPSPAPTLSIAGGSASNVTRSYVVTWVTAFGEEGPPSSPVTSTNKSDATWTVTLPTASGTTISNYNLSKARVYRTVGSTFYLVVEQAIGTTTYADTNTDATVSANAALLSTTWTAPPTDLQGWVTMPNGMIAGFRGSEVWFCEPYRPHAWPSSYAVSVEYPVVGLGVTNQTLVICTNGYPVVATGVNPSSISMSKLASFEPCMSRGSIVSAPEGVYYASPNGLVLVANGVANLVTDGLIWKDEWNRLVPVSTLRATRLGNAYYAWGSSRAGVFDTGGFDTNWTQQADFSGGYAGFLIDPSNQRIAFNSLATSVPVTNIFTDAWSGETFMIKSDVLYRINIADESAARDVYKWRSKIFQPVDKKNLAAMRVYFEIPPWVTSQNPVRNTDINQTLASDQYGIVRVYADGTLVMARELRTSGELMKFPSGFKADFWQVEIEAYVKVMSFQMASSTKELMKV